MCPKIKLPGQHGYTSKVHVLVFPPFFVFCSSKINVVQDSLVFRRKRDEGGLLDYAEETYAVKRFLDTTHPIRDESCPPKSGFSYR